MTGRPARLSQEAIIVAAEAILADNEIEALTMRRVAKELDSSPMAIYRHVRNKDELLFLLLDRAAAGLPRPRLSADPRARLLEVFQILYDGLETRPWIVRVLSRGDLIAPSVLWAIDEIVSAFVAAGLTHEQAGAAYLVAWRYTVGHLAVRHETARQAAKLDRPPLTSSILAKIDAREFPALAELESFWPSARERDSYPEDLAAVVDGLLARAP